MLYQWTEHVATISGKVNLNVMPSIGDPRADNLCVGPSKAQSYHYLSLSRVETRAESP